MILRQLFPGKRPASAAAGRDRMLMIDGRQVPVRVAIHPRASRMTLRIQPGGEALKVTMPAHVGNAELDAFLERNRHWAASRLARLPDRVIVEEGALIPYRGVPHRILHLDRLRGVVESRRVGEEDALLVPGEPDRVAARLAAHLKREARRDLDRSVMHHSARLGVRPRQLRITDTTSRWGSCSSTRTLSFSWRIIMAPPPVLDYLAAHEVAHLREMNHSPRFWALVEELCPQMKAHKAWLRTHGQSLHAISFDAR